MENYIFDFDGTLTDVEKSTKDWQNKYPMVCAKILGIDYKKIKPHFYELKADLKNHPEKGFMIAGYDSLPANSDPYIRSQATIQELVGEIRNGNIDITCKLPEDETEFLIKAYIETNKISQDKNYFRAGTKYFLDKLKENHNIVIVTNSDDKKVKKSLETISHDDIPVFGNAKKLFINNSIESLENFRYDSKVFKPDMNVANLLPSHIIFGHATSGYFPRSIHVRRKGYFDILKNLIGKGFLSENTTVVGDIFELDLALPLTLGYKVIQIDNGSTPEHEKNYGGKDFAFVNNLYELEKLLL